MRVNLFSISVCLSALVTANSARAQELLPRADQAGAATTLSNPDIVVTAQKRSERLQDVPVPISVLNTASLAERNQGRLQDYFATVPGLNFTGGGAGSRGGTAGLSIRGLTTGGVTGPTVGVVIDDIPYGSSTGVGLGAAQYPDIDPSDLERIEVLRGPQGTLYGASSLGGLIKFVTVDPSTKDIRGNIQVVGTSVDHGEYGYGIRAALNVPLSETLAVRASGFSRRDPGYVDNALSGMKDTNRVDVYGGHFAALWQPIDTFRVKMSALIQNSDGDGDGSVDVDSAGNPPSGGLTQSRLKETGDYKLRLRAYSAEVKGSLGEIEATSLTGYSTTRYSVFRDNTSGFGSFAQSFFNTNGAGIGTTSDVKKFTQEIRLNSPSTNKLEWLLGAFYTHESAKIDQPVYAVDPATGNKTGLVADFYYPSTLDEYSVFGSLTYHFTDRFDIQIGGRQSHNKQKYDETDSGPFVPVALGFPSPLVYETEHTNENSFTYLVTPRFKISQDLMVYARFTSGYRAGGPNFTALLFDAPVHYGPDKTYNYEIGLKGSLLDRKITFDASVFYIDWRDIQLTLEDPATLFSFYGNGGRAKSQGVELSVQTHPVKGLSLGASGSYTEAELTENLPVFSQAYGRDGDRLPFSARVQGSVSADLDVPLTDDVTGFAGAIASYVGKREADFAASATANRRALPGYGNLDVRIGIRAHGWTASVFTNNITDKRGVLTNVSSGRGGRALNYTQPRTAGISLAKAF